MKVFTKIGSKTESYDLESFEPGSRLGTFIVNGELFGLKCLMHDVSFGSEEKVLVAICKEEEFETNNFSGYIPKNFLIKEFPEEEYDLFVCLEGVKIKTDDELSLGICALYETKDTSYWGDKHKEYLESIGFNIDLERGYEMVREYLGE